MKFSAGQETAIRDVCTWIKDKGRKQVFYLAGFAGTGKTTIAKHILGETGKKAAVAAYTGKAAQVLCNKGLPASTIHRLIYHPAGGATEEIKKLRAKITLTNDPAEQDHLEQQLAELVRASQTPGFIKKPIEDLEEYDLILLDECSMIDKKIGEDLLAFKKPILVMGDPAQLPPIKGAGFFTSNKPDVLLTEIHRQAEENPIIRLATEIRLGQPLRHQDLGQARVVPKGAVPADGFLAASQVLCGMNATRHRTNRWFRKQLGHAGLPKQGEKVICTKNDHEAGLLNGSIMTVTRDAIDDPDDPFVCIFDAAEGPATHEALSVYRQPFVPDNLGELSYWEKRSYQEFDYGYAITCHKAQGSEWENVLVLDDGLQRRDVEFRKQWLYTAITRAMETVTIITE